MATPRDPWTPSIARGRPPSHPDRPSTLQARDRQGPLRRDLLQARDRPRGVPQRWCCARWRTRTKTQMGGMCRRMRGRSWTRRRRRLTIDLFDSTNQRRGFSVAGEMIPAAAKCTRALQYTNRRGVPWFLHEGTTKTGKPRYSVAKFIGPGALHRDAGGLRVLPKASAAWSFVCRVGDGSKRIADFELELVLQ